LFVNTDTEEQFVFGLSRDAPEKSIVAEIVHKGGGVLVDNLHDTRTTTLDMEDWSTHFRVHLVPMSELGQPGKAAICKQCGASVVSVHFVFECARADKLFDYNLFTLPPNRPFQLPERPLSLKWNTFKSSGIQYIINQRLKSIESISITS